MFGRAEQAKPENGGGMPKTGAKRRPLERTQKAKRVRPSAPLLETRARTILETMVEEVANVAPAGLTLPEVPEPIATAPAVVSENDATQTIDELATGELVSIVQQGASLEVDGSRYTSDELALIAENVTGQAHLKISNSGGFSARELAAIANSGPGQVIFA
jgi:hypothetical protein